MIKRLLNQIRHGLDCIFMPMVDAPYVMEAVTEFGVKKECIIL